MTAQQILKKYFNYDNFRAAQEEIISEILSGTNVIAILPTGAGKSLCYQIPALMGDDYTIVISPLIALMKDQVDSLNKTSEIAAFVNSTQSDKEVEQVLQNIKYGKIKIVYVAPERLENPEFANRLKSLNPNYLFVDEAHCISQWGHNFRPSYTKIKDFIKFTGIKKISAFTATATPEVVKDIIKQLELKNSNLIIKGFKRDNLFITAEITKKKKERCLLLCSQYKGTAIIYTSSRKKAEELSEYLKLNKLNCEYYHAGLDPIIRKKIQEDFIEDRLPVIVATNAFGMGIDKKDIRLVIHYNTPGTIENYYQEIGRAGRDGKFSHVYLLFDENDIFIQEYFINNSYPDKQTVQKIYNAIGDYAQIAVGSLPSDNIKLDLSYIKLHTKQDLNPALVNSALNYLSESGYIKSNSAYNYSNKIKIIFDENRLKKFIKNTSNVLMKDLIISLLRNYGSDIFIRLTKIDLEQLKFNSGLTEEEIQSSLASLEYLGIIEFSKSSTKETITFLKPRVKSSDIRLNFKHINELYINAKQKLDAMKSFVYDDGCRFRFILNYFGEQTENYSCGKCDNCLRTGQFQTYSVDYLKEKILELLTSSKLSLSDKDIFNILLGTAKKDEYQNLTYFGLLKSYNKEDLNFAFKSLLKENKVTTIKKGKNLLYCSINNSTDTTSEIDSGNNEEIIDKNIELFHKLREVREKASKKFLQSPAIICPDPILAKAAEQKPKSKIELLAIDGFNERMFNKLGEEMLEVINNTISVKDDLKTSEEVIPKNIIETFRLLKQNYSLSEISQLRRLTEAVISMQIETIISYIPEIDISSIIDSDRLEKINLLYKKGIKDLKTLKEKLPKDFSYPEIRVALAKFSHQGF
ncbi:MAG: RecQ family ATP-dependent DNA helicase [Ignavibacterium sp.]|jgi:ATP-dependent DNA helicase RecQ|nr:RecQ family ATP-dependent DNA helicase [Ignavibacterium sp.]MDX9712670.1 RecQ family ATP-dependent DNA helicase [Ignavibacteriaceae bacterium]MEB2354263.1 RecQ family ATP-dependent DNA helicase [Ignavibacteriales bacterium]